MTESKLSPSFELGIAEMYIAVFNPAASGSLFAPFKDQLYPAEKGRYKDLVRLKASKN